ncbi:MAG: Asp23/Gls24 family envelope stress response protein [Elusimicrobia bacterium]|nr:Asp23/Gls24 family envelope stress response protein [Elusimicrobiota bacterium]
MGPDARIDLGAIEVHKNVLADIATAAIKDVEGVTPARYELAERVMAWLGRSFNSAVEVRADVAGQVSLVIKVKVRYGLNLAEVSQKVQDKVLTAVERMADIDLKDVDVSIEGIERGESCGS